MRNVFHILGLIQFDTAIPILMTVNPLEFKNQSDECFQRDIGFLVFESLLQILHPRLPNHRQHECLLLHGSPFLFFLGNTKRHGSRGLIWNSKLRRAPFSSSYHKSGALQRPYADFNNLQRSQGWSFTCERISTGGSIPSTRPSERLPRRNAVWTSKLRMRHFTEAAYCKIRVRESFPSVG